LKETKRSKQGQTTYQIQEQKRAIYQQEFYTEGCQMRHTLF